jgi:hypothetical protein
MMNSKWLILGAVVGCFSGASLGACGNSGTSGTTGAGGTGGSTSDTTTGTATATGTTTTATGTTSSTVTSSTTGAGGGTSSTSATTGAGGSGGSGGGPCGATGVATTLHPPAADAGTNTIYCPFSSMPGGKNVSCDHTSEHCCEPAMGMAACDPIATACAAGDTDWQCESPNDCGMGQVCCGIGSVIVNPDPMCANKGKSFKGTHCAASCMAGSELEMCDAQMECGAGKTCTPFKTHGAQVGACL